MLCRSIADAIGNTPVVELSRLAARHELKPNLRLFAKLEHLNPGYSKKDRVAKRMVWEAQQSDALLPGQPVVELTSGNTGIGLAICCAAEGHAFTAVMSRGNSVERARMMRALGARVELVDQAAGAVPGQVSQQDLELVEQRARQLVQEQGAFRADQFSLLANENAHYYGTASEVWHAAQLRPSAFVDFAGTGGTFSGMAKFFKEQDASMHCAWVEPEQAKHQIQGGGYFTLPSGGPLPFYELAKQRGHVDSVIKVSDEESIDMCRELARVEGIFGGYSAGANAAAAIKLLKEKQRGGKEEDYSVLFLVCDSGLKYLSLGLYEQ